MQNNKFIKARVRGLAGYITLDRPDVHNALHIEMIREISETLDLFNKEENLKAIVIDANGKNFSAGADLKWMKSGISQSDDQLRAESHELALLFNKIMNSNSITICALKGKVIGGANGIAAASDIVIAAKSTSFAFTEVKLGLIPATIAPYVYRKSKERSMEWMLTGRTISAEEALAGGIINHIVDEHSLESTSDSILKMILSNGPKALKGVKKLFLSGLIEKHPDDTIKQTSGLIADFRTSSEGLEGLTSFFEKRKPSWMNEN